MGRSGTVRNEGMAVEGSLMANSRWPNLVVGVVLAAVFKRSAWPQTKRGAN